MKKLLLSLLVISGSLYGGVSVNPPSKINGPNGASVDTASGVSINPGSGGSVNVVSGDTYVPTRIDFSTTVSPTLTAAGHAAIAFDGTYLKLSINGGAYTTLGSAFTYDTAPVGVPFLASVTGVSFKTVAATTIFTVPAGKTFVCTGGWAVLTSVTGYSSSTLANFTFIESSGGSTLMNTVATSSGFQVAGKVAAATFTATTTYTAAPAASNVQINVTQATSSTTMACSVFVTGFYY